MNKQEWKEAYHNYRLYNRMARLYFDAVDAHKKRPIKYKELTAIRDKALEIPGSLQVIQYASGWLRSWGRNGGVYIWKTLPSKQHVDETFVYYPHVSSQSREFVRISGKTFIARRRIYFESLKQEA